MMPVFLHQLGWSSWWTGPHELVVCKVAQTQVVDLETRISLNGAIRHYDHRPRRFVVALCFPEFLER
jgi:hypothetical protein